MVDEFGVAVSLVAVGVFTAANLLFMTWALWPYRHLRGLEDDVDKEKGDDDKGDIE